MRRRIHACLVRRRIHACHIRNGMMVHQQDRAATAHSHGTPQHAFIWHTTHSKHEHATKCHVSSSSYASTHTRTQVPSHTNYL
jgi:hypothetical protein